MSLMTSHVKNCTAKEKIFIIFIAPGSRANKNNIIINSCFTSNIIALEDELEPIVIEGVLVERVIILKPCKFPDLFWNQLRIKIEIVYIPNVLKNNTSTHN